MLAKIYRIRPTPEERSELRTLVDLPTPGKERRVRANSC